MWVYLCIFSFELEVTCFDLAGGKWTFPNGMMCVRSMFSYLAPRDLVSEVTDILFLNGKPTFSHNNVPQGSRIFVSCLLYLTVVGCLLSGFYCSCLLEGGSMCSMRSTNGGVVLALWARLHGYSCFWERM